MGARWQRTYAELNGESLRAFIATADGLRPKGWARVKELDKMTIGFNEAPSVSIFGLLPFRFTVIRMIYAVSGDDHLKITRGSNEAITLSSGKALTVDFHRDPVLFSGKDNCELLCHIHYVREKMGYKWFAYLSRFVPRISPSSWLARYIARSSGVPLSK